MVKLERIENVRIRELVKDLISEQITKSWLKDILLGKRIKASHIFRDSSESEFFNLCIWDNLSTEQQKKATDELNILLDEDLYKPITNNCGYLQNLVELACLLGTKNPKAINSKLLIDWKEKRFPNLTIPKTYEGSLHQEFTLKIENSFGKYKES